MLYLDYNPNDIELTCRHFASHAPHIHLQTIFSNEEMFRGAIQAERGPIEFDALAAGLRAARYDALDLLKELRQVSRLDLPIILVTGQGDEDLPRRCPPGPAIMLLKPGIFVAPSEDCWKTHTTLQLLHEQASTARQRRAIPPPG